MFNIVKEVTTNIKYICANDHAPCLNCPCLPEKQERRFGVVQRKKVGAVQKVS
jgi:hypothetical protein